MSEKLTWAELAVIEQRCKNALGDLAFTPYRTRAINDLILYDVPRLLTAISLMAEALSNVRCERCGGAGEQWDGYRNGLKCLSCEGTGISAWARSVLPEGYEKEAT